MNTESSNNISVEQSMDFFKSELFKRVQLSGMFSDSKTFTDAIPKQPLAQILAAYQQTITDSAITDAKDIDDEALARFIDDNFILPTSNEIIIAQPSSNINEQIHALWQGLRKSADTEHNSSLLPLSHPYIVPGGRFREIYYWDSYFTALGLLESNKLELVEAMLANFVDLQTRYGCIPNGNRSYYLSRSQPPILGLMVELILPFKTNKAQFLSHYIQGIETEYNFWMRGQAQISEASPEHGRLVRMPNGSVLNRYWDDSCTPRPESYREDIELVNETNPDNIDDFYRNIRAACESGWDFSSRWLADANDLASIKTTRFIPVDLNCLLYKQECLLAQYYRELGDEALSAQYQDKADARKAAINTYLWSAEQGYFFDYDLDHQTQSSVLSAAGAVPLFVELVTAEQAQKVADVIELRLLKQGGLITTEINSSQQWDAPNGWAPLQWFAYQGLQNYQLTALASTIQQRWLTTVELTFNATGKLMEKYNVCQQQHKAGGGEYDVQEGFGWTNGVYQALAAKK